MLFSKQILLPLLVYYITPTQQLENPKSVNDVVMNQNQEYEVLYSHLAGELSADLCVMSCGCKGFNYAGHLNNTYCWCGDTAGDVCNSDSCVDEYSTSGISSSFATLPAQKVKLFENLTLDITSVAGISKYGAVINNQLSEYDTNAPIVQFIEPGNNTLVVEPGAYYGCQSKPHFIHVYEDANVTLECNLEILNGEDIHCYANLSGTELTQLKWFKDGVETVTVSNPASPHYYSVGGEMKTNRFEEYWESYSWERNNNTGYINRNHEFKTTGKLYGFEAHITRLNKTEHDHSCINFMVVRPKCSSADSEGRFCTLSKTCALATACTDGKTHDDDPYDYDTYLPDGTNKVWATNPGRYTNAGNFTAPPIRELSVVETGYVIDYIYTAYAYQIGSNVFKVPEDEQFTVQPGHFLGWYPCVDAPGDIAYYPIDPVYEDKHSEEEIPDMYRNFVGGRILRKYFATQYFISHYEHMLRAHVKSEASYLEIFPASDTIGTTYRFKVELTSENSEEVYSAEFQTDIVDVIENLTLASQPYGKAGSVFNMTVKQDKGSNINYCINWGDRINSETDCHDVVSTPIATHTYMSPGEYNVFIKAYNTLSNDNITVPITMLGNVENVKMASENGEIPPANTTGDFLEIDVLVAGTGFSAIQIEYLYANGLNYTGSFNVTLSSYFYVHIEKMFFEADDILCTVTGKNKFQNKSLSLYGTVEDPVGAFELQTNVTGATLNSTLYTIYEHVGTNVTYVWDWGDGEMDNISYIRNANHTYKTYGNKTVNITAYNKVSEMSLSFEIDIQDTIFNIEFYGDSHAFTEYTKPSIIFFKLAEGTGINCWIDYNKTENDTSPLLSPILFDLDIPDDDSYLLAYGNFTYTEKGLFNVTIYCENDISNVSLSTIMPVEDKITDFVTVLKQEYEGDFKDSGSGIEIVSGFYDWVEVNETLNVTVSVSNQGEVWFVYDAGDGRPNITTKNRTWLFHYPVGGVGWNDAIYPIIITAYNRVDRVNHTNITIVPQYLQNLTEFQIIHAPENSTEPLEMRLSILSGDWFNCSWNFSDGSLNQDHFVSYDDFVLNKGLVKHQFAADSDPMKPGEYNVTVNCSSRLYHVETNATVLSYTPVSLFFVTLFSHCDNKNRTVPYGLRGDLLPLSCTVVFVITEQIGTNVSYHIDFGYKNESNQERVTAIEYNPIQPLTEFSHLFQVKLNPTETEKKLTVKIVAQNNVSSVLKEVALTLITPVGNVTVETSEKPAALGTPTEFFVTADELGYKACYELDLGVTNPVILFGDISCKGIDKFLFHTYVSVKLVAGKKISLYKHIYVEANVYDVKVKGENDFSSVSSSAITKVIEFPCNKPDIKWASAMADAVENVTVVAPFFRCRKYNILTKAIPDCSKPNTSVIRDWTIKRILDKNGQPIVSEEGITLLDAPSRYVIDERSLEYGYYEVEFRASMFDNLTQKIVRETTQTLTGYFLIKQCPLFAAIAGGNGIAVGHEGKLIVDGSLSTDHDIDPGKDMGLVFKWYCKREHERFPPENEIEQLDNNRIVYPASPAPATLNSTFDRSNFEGCFGNGIGRFAYPDLTGPIIKIDKQYMLYKEVYNLWMHVSKKDRDDPVIVKYTLKILKDSPPIVSISCKLNCLMKKNPTQKTSLVAVCDNCGSKPAIYKWNMVRTKVPGVGEQIKDMKEEDMTETLRDCASTNIDIEKNLVMPAFDGTNTQCLEAGFQYCVKLKTYWDDGSGVLSEEESGFAMYVIDVNYPPDIVKGKVNVLWVSGNRNPYQALDTKFRLVVSGVVDEDIPLSYNFFYKVMSVNETEWIAPVFSVEGTPESEPFTLPPGFEEKGYEIKLKATVSDVYLSTSQDLETSIKVEPKQLTMEMIKEMLASPEIKYDSSALGNVFSGLIDSLKDPNSNLPQDEVKDLIKSILPSIVLDSPSTVAMVASVLDGASDESTEPLSEEALLASLDTAKKMAEFASELTPEQLDKITKQALAATAKFTGVLAGNNSADNLKAAMEAEAKFTSGSGGNMIAGERPTVIITANGETQVTCEPGKGNVGQFSVPDLRRKDELCAGVTNTMSTKNRYSFVDKEGPSAIVGPLYGLSVSGGMGKQRTIANLTEPIRLVLPNPDPIPDVLPTYNAYCNLMQIVHLVDCHVNETNLIVKVRPTNESFDGNMFVFINKGYAPSLLEHDINCTLPRPYPSNWSSLSAEDQIHFEEEDKWRCFIESKEMNDLCTGRWVAGVTYFTNSTNRTKVLYPSSYSEDLVPCKKVNYTFLAYTRACLWWNEELKMWSGKGCKASRETKDNETVCYCDHLTDFGGGGLFAKPNPINFGAAFAGFMNISNNPTVFAVVLSSIILYFIMLLWARKKDKKDVETKKVYKLEDNHPNDNYYYQVAVKTGHKSGSGTTADVCITLTGTEGETSPKRLHNPNRKCFQKNGIDLFLVAVPYSLGKICEVEVYHNNTGQSPGWYLNQIEIKDVQTQKTSLFICNQWLDVTEDDGEILRKLDLAKRDDIQDISFVFSQSLIRNMYDGHIWLSIFMKPTQSSFTRVQRLTTCFALLMTNMVANAMLYVSEDAGGPKGPPELIIRMGPFLFSLTQLRIALTSALIVLPAHLLVVILFKKAASKKNTYEEKYGVVEDKDKPSKIVTEKIEEPMTEDAIEEEEDRVRHNSRLSFWRSIFFPGGSDSEASRTLPHWLIYVAYVLALITAFVSAFFVILYGFDFGKEKSDKWIVCFLISLAESIFLLQPLKVVILSILFSVLVREPPKTVEAVEEFSIGNKIKNEADIDEELEREAGDNLQFFKMPDAKRLEEARQQRMKEKIVKAIVQEIIVHLSFVVLCLVVCYAAADPASYTFGEGVHTMMGSNSITKSYFDGKAYMLEDIEPDGKTQRDVKSASEIGNRLEWIDWARYSVIEYLFMNNWYNGSQYTLGWVADSMQSKILAMARFRQNRIKPMSCTKHPVFEHLIVECNAGYSAATEQTGQFSPGWKPPFNESTIKAERKGKRKALYLGYEDPWRFQSSADLKNFPYTGRFATYGGSSYSVSIGPKKKVAKKVLKAMKDNFWIDRYTRSIFTEVNIYNAHTNLLLIVTYLHEILPTGGWNYWSNIQTIRLFRYIGGLGSLIMLFDVIFSIVTVVGLYKMIRAIKKTSFKIYLSNFWNLLHFIVTVSSLLAIFLTVGRFFAVREAMKQFRYEPELFVSFGYIGMMENFTLAFLGFVLFFTNLEFLRILRFNKSIADMIKTMKILGTPLLSFGMTFVVIFMAYVSFAHCLFADKLEQFRDVKQSFVAMTMMFMGQFSIYEFLDNAPTFGPIMFFSYMLAIQMILINLFVGIICDAYAEVGEMEPDDQPSVLSFMASRVKNITANGTGSDPIYTDWKDDWEVMMDKLTDECDNCIYLMRNFESEEVRQSKWFEPESANEKKKNILTAIIGSDFYDNDNEFMDGLGEIQSLLKRMSPAEVKVFLKAAALKRHAEQDDGRSTAFSHISTDNEQEDDSEMESD